MKTKKFFVQQLPMDPTLNDLTTIHTRWDFAKVHVMNVPERQSMRTLGTALAELTGNCVRITPGGYGKQPVIYKPKN